MKVLRVLNNNVVLARREGLPSADQGDEVIVTGRGVGFGMKQGQTIDPDKVVKVFVSMDGRDPDHAAEMLAAVPPVFVRLVVEAMVAAEFPAKLSERLTFVVAVADHISMAVRRHANGDHVAYPLRAEVEHLYGDDYRLAGQLLEEINQKMDIPLPQDEAVALTLHLVNAGFSTGDLSYTYKMTGLIQQIIDVVSSFYGEHLDSTTVSVARFITHLRYLFVRIAQHGQLTSEHSAVADAIMESYPQAAECAGILESLLELRLDASLTGDELAYLALHIARLAPTQ
ncbi:transcription antiterminator BglG [Corynebacterium phocae]|uniref:Transcription antiterminator BglG n=1 Tax=Corynebacterium phocae TaxID=161895 RepID=A0A1L7D360_9CORY|nr:PRD domain-containing protein [Corynebacterium phocae]APT92606.1 transcription antiterminator BglG [Corynebacterium phocae]KAA8724162.1 PRD domain-containing protein [Corynebacterium phocae]